MNKWDRYANDVISGKQVACREIIAACKRYKSDLEKGVWIFDVDRAEMACNFIENLKLTEGSWAGNDFVLEDWQAFIVANVFGWVDKHGKRRFRKVYEEVARKNAKSTKVAAILNYMFFMSGEQRAQVYSLATKLDQAMFIFEAAAAQVQYSEILSECSNVYNSVNNRRIVNHSTSSYFRPLEWNPKKQDGMNPFAVGIDEYHAHDNDDAVSVIETGMGSREEPLSYKVTTAGFNKLGPCYKYRDYCKQILNGTVTDDRTFVMIYTLDEEDDWTNPDNWIKANPNLGVSVYRDFLESQLTEALQQVDKEVEFKTKNLNVWCDSAITWIPDHIWAKGQNEYSERDLEGLACFGGLDLARKNDFCALVLKFMDGQGVFRNIYRYYISQDAVDNRKDGVGASIRQWVRNGYVKTCSGDVTDFKMIFKDIIDLSRKYEIKGILYDPAGATELVLDLIDEGINMMPYSQSSMSMSAPTSELHRVVLEGCNQHNNNPVQRWMMGNVLLLTDSSGNIKIDKKKSIEKVDGPVAEVMAMAGWLDSRKQEKEPEWVEGFTL